MTRQRFFEYPDNPDQTTRTEVGPGAEEYPDSGTLSPRRGECPVVRVLKPRTSGSGNRLNSSPGARSAKPTQLDPRRYWVFYCPSAAEVAAVEEAERAEQAAAAAKRSK